MKSRMKNPATQLILLIALSALSFPAGSPAANVNAGTGYTNDFSAQPAAEDWSTRSFATGSGSSTAGEITSLTALDAAVQTNSAALISNRCASATGSPPSATGLAVWSSAGSYLQTRPTSVAAILLMASLVNVTGTNATAIHINYDYSTNALNTEEVAGHLVYYSLTGAANSWVNIPALSQASPGRLSVELALSGTWSNGATLYLLWADDNGSGSPDTAQQIDNFFVAVAGGASPQLSCVLTAPSAGQTFAAPANVTLAAAATPGEEASLTGVGFFETTQGFLASALTSPYTNSATLGAGAYSVYAVASNSLGATAFSATNLVTVTNRPFSVALVTPADGALYNSPATLALTASAYPGGGATLSSVTFYMLSNGTSTMLFANAAPPYSNQVSGLANGLYGFFAVVSNSLGATAFSTTNIIIVATLAGGTVTRGPYLGSRGLTNITVRWRTAEDTVGRVRYDTSPGRLGSFADDTTSGTNHSVTLTGLAPDTKYYYSIGTSAGTVLAGANYYFVTAPPTGAGRFTRLWFLSDYGGGDATQTAVRDAYLNYTATNGHGTDIWLTGGDNEQSQTTGADATFQTTVFNVYSNIFQNTPVFPTCGNHDGGSNSAYWSIFSLPTQGECGGLASGSQHYYSYDHANIHFISLDAYNNGSGAGANSAQLQWLTNDLAQTTQTWIIAYWHEPPYCKNFYNSDTESVCKATREHFNPVLEAYGVDLVMSGHCHALQRTKLINQHYGVSTTFTATNQVDGGDGRPDGTGIYIKTTGRGTVYVTAPAGCGLDHPGSGTMPAFAETLSYTIHGCLTIDISSNRLDFKMLSSTGAVGDYFSLLKGVTVPLVTISPQLTNGMFTVTFRAAPGFTYTVQSVDLLGGSWVNRTNLTVPASGQVPIQEPASAARQRFYRLVYPTSR
jgi:hypothetical protein